MHGRRRFQPLFRKLHQISIQGMGFGNYDPRRNGEYALLERLAERWDSPTLIDAGAHEGDWSAAALSVAPSASIHAIEPNPSCLDGLARTLGDRAEIHNVGLGHESGTVTLYAPPGLPALGSIHRRDLSAHGLPAPEPVADIALITLEEFCERNQIDHVEFLKLDLEGNELAALDGARSLIEGEAIDVIQFEFGGTDIDSRTFLRDFFDRLGETHKIHRVLRDGLEPVRYSEVAEIFSYGNYAALRIGYG
jgi:FkbM family methyltransferase